MYSFHQGCSAMTKGAMNSLACAKPTYPHSPVYQVPPRGCCELAPSLGPRILMVLEGSGQARAPDGVPTGPKSGLESELDLEKGIYQYVVIVG